ncbi:MAG: hypothetical protein WA021_00435, partial [Minisyncoccia bacterium]
MKLLGVSTNFASYGMAKMSHGIFLASENYRATDVPLVNYLLYCLSVELGLKASILRLDNSKANKKILKEHTGHDLVKMHSEFDLEYPSVLDDADGEALKAINPFYKNKGLEFMTAELQIAL